MQVLENINGKATHRIIVLEIESKRTKSFSIEAKEEIETILEKLKKNLEAAE